MNVYILLFYSFILHLIYMLIYQFAERRNGKTAYDIAQVPNSVFCIVFLWPFLQLALCEFSKRKYIKYV